MKKYLPLFLLPCVLLITACAAPTANTPTPLPSRLPPPALITAVDTPTAAPTAVPPTQEPEVSEWKTYENPDFRLKFEYPATWFGPDEYVSDQMLRLEVGSDKVYPYGTDRTEQIYTQKNSYYVLLQYSRNDQNSYWKDPYDSLVGLKDGESRSSARSQVIKVRDLTLGRFKGVEYISTLSETAQTEPVYLRQVILFDDTPNVLTMMGQPNNVEIGDEGWRTAYQVIDEANEAIFDHILNSISAE